LRFQEALFNYNLRGVTLGKGAPIHSLLFADDLILCGTTTLQEAQTIKTILYDFCHQLGQTPNLQKSSIFFSHNVTNQVKNKIRYIFPVSNLVPNYYASRASYDFLSKTRIGPTILFTPNFMLNLALLKLINSTMLVDFSISNLFFLPFLSTTCQPFFF
jgi:hypothetical protein